MQELFSRSGNIHREKNTEYIFQINNILSEVKGLKFTIGDGPGISRI